MIQLVALPQETGLIATALLDVPVKTVVGYVGAPALEPLHLNLALVSVEIGLDVLLLELQIKQQLNKRASSQQS